MWSPSGASTGATAGNWSTWACLSRAAQAHARAGDLDAACATGDEAVSIAETVQSARLREHLRDLAADLRRGGSSRRSGVGARVLTERIAALAS